MKDYKPKGPDLSEEDEKLIVEFMKKMAALMKRETDKCCHCGHAVQAMEKIGRCVYARPCGCRLWQGQVPDAWKKPNSI